MHLQHQIRATWCWTPSSAPAQPAQWPNANCTGTGSVLRSTRSMPTSRRAQRTSIEAIEPTGIQGRDLRNTEDSAPTSRACPSAMLVERRPSVKPRADCSTTARTPRESTAVVQADGEHRAINRLSVDRSTKWPRKLRRRACKRLGNCGITATIRPKAMALFTTYVRSIRKDISREI